MMTFLSDYWDALLMMTAEMAPYLILGFFFAGLLRAFVPASMMRRHLAPRNMKSVVKAAAIGVPLPLCSCGVIPTSVGLRREGASHGACTSFLIATPQTGVDSITATYSMMGLPFAVIRPIAALFTAMFGGWLVNRYARDDEQHSAEAVKNSEHAHCHCGHHHEEEEESGCCHDDHHHEDEEGGCHCHDGHDEGCHCHEGHSEGHSLFSRLTGAMRYAFVEMLQDVGKWLVVGLLIAALITVAVPNDWLAALQDYKLLNMMIVLAIAIPMYVCATGSIPIAVSLMAKGLTPGAALVFLMAGPAVNSASMLVVGKVFGKRTLWLYILSVVAGAIVFGLGIDYLFPASWFTVSGVAGPMGHCADCLGTWDWIWIGLLALLLVNAFTRMLIPARHPHHKDAPTEASSETESSAVEEPAATAYKVSGMSCNHCKASVEKAISEVSGVESVDVDLPRGMAYVRGVHDSGAVVKAVSDIGFKAELRQE